MEEKRIRHEKTLNEMQQALEHIQRASNITSCALCIRDLTLAELLLQNIISVIRELLEKNDKEKKEKGDTE